MANLYAFIWNFNGYDRHGRFYILPISHTKLKSKIAANKPLKTNYVMTSQPFFWRHLKDSKNVNQYRWGYFSTEPLYQVNCGHYVFSKVKQKAPFTLYVFVF